MHKISIGIIGLGTVGSGIIKIINENKEYLSNKLGFSLEIKKILLRDLNKTRNVDVPPEILTTNFNDLITDDIKIIVEVAGGEGVIKDYVFKAIKNGKYVVTANKQLLANYSTDIFALANEYNVEVGFEASVAGTIPIIRALKEGLVANKINKLVGILNGTCNYILTQMTENNISYEEALSKAQEKGFAEADPSLDINGFDSAYKLAILSTIAFGTKINMNNIHIEGIKDISENEIARFNSFNLLVKLLGIAEKTDDGLFIRVHPALISKKHPLAGVRNEFNAVYIEGDSSKETMFYGRGAGQLPTASAVMSDIIEISKIIINKCDNQGCAQNVMKNGTKLHWSFDDIYPITKVCCPYYLNLPILDKPGIIGDITTVLGENNISIAGVKATIINKDKEIGLVEIMTHPIEENAIRNAINKIGVMPTIRGDIKFYRLLEMEQE